MPSLGRGGERAGQLPRMYSSRGRGSKTLQRPGLLGTAVPEALLVWST